MSNLRTILEELVKNIQDGDLTVFGEEMLESAEQEIKELMLGKAEILNEICLLAQEEIRAINKLGRGPADGMD